MLLPLWISLQSMWEEVITLEKPQKKPRKFKEMEILMGLVSVTLNRLS